MKECMDTFIIQLCNSASLYISFGTVREFSVLNNKGSFPFPKKWLMFEK